MIRTQKGAAAKLKPTGAPASWQTRWHEVPLSARAAFLKCVSSPQWYPAISWLPLPRTEMTQADLGALRSAGFLSSYRGGESIDRMNAGFSPAEIVVAQKLRTMDRHHPLRNGASREWILGLLGGWQKLEAIRKILDSAGQPVDSSNLETQFVNLYVKSRHWQQWVAERLKSPIAAPLLDALYKAGGRVRWTELASLLPGRSTRMIEAAVDTLLMYLVLSADLNEKTLDIEVGLLPEVMADLRRHHAGNPRTALVVVPTPARIDPDTGFFVPVLRTLLFELAASPARLRQNDELFAKELDRLVAVADTVPGIAESVAVVERAQQVRMALKEAEALQFAAPDDSPRGSFLTLAERGLKWLSHAEEEQYEAFFTARREQPRERLIYDIDPTDDKFIGASVSLRATNKTVSSFLRREQASVEAYTALRGALHRAFLALPIGQFVVLESFVEHAGFGPQNPLTVTAQQQFVTLSIDNTPVPPLLDFEEKYCKIVLRLMLVKRLIPLGCVQLGLDDKGRYLIARLPRLDVYFGAKRADAPAPVAGTVSTRVIVQPDFSVMILGTNQAPAVDLLPFCDRVPGRSGPGSLTLRMTRDTVVRAAAAGLSGDEILARLQRYASKDIPQNVATEVREWASWVRKVDVEPMLVLRCPDAAAAERAVAVLGRKAERIGDRCVALLALTLSAAERQKLFTRGIVVANETETPRKKRRR